MSQNKALHRACRAWLKAALSVFTGNVAVMVTQKWDITLTADGHSARAKWESDYGRTMVNAQPFLTGLPEYAAIMEIVSADPTLRSVLYSGFTGEVPADPEQQKHCLYAYLDRLLLEYLRPITHPARPVPMMEAEFERIYEQLERFVYTDSFPAAWLFYLRNLRSDVVTVPLEDDVAIRQATPDERIEILQEYHQNPQASSGGPFFQAPEAFIEIRHSVDRTTQPDSLAAMEIARAAVIGLWLLKANPVGLSGSRWRVVDQPFRLLPALGGGPVVPWDAFRGEPYILTKDDAKELGRLWPRVKRAMQDDELSTAITRLDDSYGRTKQEDRLIDYWTALESLFLPLDSHVQDMGETVALVVAHYLGRNASERSSIRNDITRSHTLRSHLVHGKRGQPKHDVTEMVSKTGDHLRHALRKRVME